MFPFSESTVTLADGPSMSPNKRTTEPIVTGASVLAVKYSGGVMMMADTLGSYGSLAMFKHLKRIAAVNDTCLMGASGEFSDFQYIQRLLHELTTRDYSYADGAQLTAQEIHSYMARVMYNRRSKVNPLWNSLIIAGCDAETATPFLGMVDIYGSNYEGDLLATGYGQHLAIPILRKQQRNDMSEKEARQMLEDCMRVLVYRDCRTLNSFLIATITKDGPTISEPFSLETQWEYKRFVNPRDSAITSEKEEQKDNSVAMKS